ncbi:hypothetical protein GF402_04125 [Candidatus Fermentibacteria bacterium]|nr:hypothetical protein [Candidatus Fermentibacteria bacterium]
MKASLEEYEKSLRNAELVPDHHVKYMVWWVPLYLSLGTPELAEFATRLETEGREDWQIRQALDAVKLYNRVLGEDEERCYSAQSPPLKQLVESLRLRHYSRSTVKAYSYWADPIVLELELERVGQIAELYLSGGFEVAFEAQNETGALVGSYFQGVLNAVLQRFIDYLV